MIVRNWMNPRPAVVAPDTLVSEVKRILNDGNLRAVAVVDDAGLRGVITRANCLRAAASVTRLQDPHELAYFAKRLKAKDLMVRNPATVDAGDTMESCLLRGQEDGISQFPVVEAGRVVGMVSASEIFHLAARVLGAWESWCGVTLAPMPIRRGTVRGIAELVENAGGTICSIFTVGADDRADPGPDSGTGTAAVRKVIVRFRDAPVDGVVAALRHAGHQVLEACDDRRRCRSGEPAP